MDELAEYYARRTAEYDEIYLKPERQADITRLAALIREELSGRRVLEVACGTGYWTQHIARVAASILACDINDEVLAIARSRPYAEKRPEFAIFNAFELERLPAEFDAAFAGFWVSHVKRAELPVFLAGLRDRLKAPARVVLSDNVYVPGSSTPIAFTDDCGNTYQDRTLKDGSRHRVLKNFLTEQDLLAAAGPDVSHPRYVALEYYWFFAYTVQPASCRQN